MRVNGQSRAHLGQARTRSTSRTATVTPAFFMASVDALRLSMISLSSSWCELGQASTPPALQGGGTYAALDGLQLIVDERQARPQLVQPLLLVQATCQLSVPAGTRTATQEPVPGAARPAWPWPRRRLQWIVSPRPRGPAGARPWRARPPGSPCSCGCTRGCPVVHVTARTLVKGTQPRTCAVYTSASTGSGMSRLREARYTVATASSRQFISAGLAPPALIH